MSSGMYRNAYPASAAAHSPSRRLRTSLPHARWGAKTAARDQDAQACQGERSDGQYDRQHAAEGPVAGFQELLLDDVADQAVLWSAENVGDGEDAKCWNEHQRRPGIDTWQREWEGDPPEALPGIRPQILRRVE